VTPNKKTLHSITFIITIESKSCPNYPKWETLFSVVRCRSRSACQAALSSAGVCHCLLSIVGFAVTSAVNPGSPSRLQKQGTKGKKAS